MSLIVIFYTTFSLHPCIHVMQNIPSTYYQCLKFPHNGIKVTIHVDPHSFEYCHALEASFLHSHQCLRKDIVPSNEILSSYINPNKLSYPSNPSTLLEFTFSKVKINDKGCGEYQITNTLNMGSIPLTPHAFKKPSL